MKKSVAQWQAPSLHRKSILVVTKIGGCSKVRSDPWMLSRVSQLGKTCSKKGRKCGQQATMIPVLIWATDHINEVPILNVQSVPCEDGCNGDLMSKAKVQSPDNIVWHEPGQGIQSHSEGGNGNDSRSKTEAVF
ncbi:predicted protein [Plenodomus lingam JN3]|uniref:Predicted protein n=1 Tax=Leptosphaeria maculans (strain JN3 / isolate v23.1.3 / race Av1-4-5-6-7-8) TaxID=985895 RepID=E4ZNR1_LEPMJ|nr:predicted protein [Plenodomus lingam JN3]CBX93280.1 predicted protein [Plenodomus lingam JN3]